MKFFNYIVIFTLCFVYCRCEENLPEKDDKQSEDREGKQLLDNLNHGGWRTVNPEWQISDGWVPRDNNPEAPNEYMEKPAMRRRRIRKRKRRPPSEEFDDFSDHGNPYTLQDTHDTWMDMEEMEEEDTYKPHNRRRLVPVYTSEELPKPQQVYEKVRDPFTALQEVEAKSRLKKKPEFYETTTMPNLKAILKQTGNGLSLSEILQRKNLSLADLLKGKQQAISALTEKMELTTEPVSLSTSKQQKSTNRNNDVDDNLFERMSSTEIIHLPNYSTSVKSYEVVTEPTTERRMFIPTYPKLIPFHYKASTVKTATTNSPISSSTINNNRNKYSDYRLKYVSMNPKMQNLLPVTSAKLNKLSSPLQKHEFITTATPLKAFTIDLKDLFGYSEISTTKKTPSTEDAPMRMVINMENMAKHNIESSTTIKTVKETENSQNSSKKYAKLKPLNAREEIMEVLKDQMSRQSLARILELRNMTIEELVALRERGSSQIHLADIFHNQTREPEPPSEPYIGTITSYNERKAKTLQNSFEATKTSDKSNYINAVVDFKSLPLDSKHDPGTKPPMTSFPTYKIAVDRILKKNEAPPFELSVWKTLYPNLYPDKSDSDKKEIEQAQVNEIFQNEVSRIEEIENTISEAVNNKLNVEFNENSYEKEDSFLRLPSGVKSAIIASAILVGISLLVFLTILIICKWSHKKKTRLCYSDAYSGSKIRSPILETRPKRTIRTIMNETLGRKKKYSNAYPQNISDYFWENDKKPFQ